MSHSTLLPPSSAIGYIRYFPHPWVTCEVTLRVKMTRAADPGGPVHCCPRLELDPVKVVILSSLEVNCHQNNKQQQRMEPSNERSRLTAILRTLFLCGAASF
ncbi:hypothetical protein RRG08_066671 [Elysia crispata]|uniref:Uncharacterized protein n=1 Tax=Elysia crispata TaxID=231223 RepID=A0AAE1EB27_9GAST|nr:hypothetical protein RRG08_066671 [Elysia crispata]